MLKKLSKYGNSTTLVIDKAILELLNMNEGSIVKLTTDGNSLTIAPVTTLEDQEKVSYEGFEALSAAKQSYEGRMISKHIDMGKVDKESKVKMLKDFQTVFKKHNQAFLRFAEVMMSQEFQDALKNITEKIDPSDNPEAFYQEFNNLKVKFCPELANMDKEIKAVGEKYNHLT